MYMLMSHLCCLRKLRKLHHSGKAWSINALMNAQLTYTVYSLQMKAPYRNLLNSK